MYMAARSYEISLRVLKNISRVNIFQHATNILPQVQRAEILRADWSKIISHTCNKNDIATGGIAFLSICYHSLYH